MLTISANIRADNKSLIRSLQFSLAQRTQLQHLEKCKVWQTKVWYDKWGGLSKWSIWQLIAFNYSVQCACLPPSSTETTSNVSSCPPGGAMSGMMPTVDTVAVKPVPAYWYYLLAGGGALLLLITVTVVVILCCHRYHGATKKTSVSHHHSVMYHNSQHPNQQGHQHSCHNPNASYNLIHSPNQTPLIPGSRPSPEPMLTIRLEKDDFDSQCWNLDYVWIIQIHLNTLFRWGDQRVWKLLEMKELHFSIITTLHWWESTWARHCSSCCWWLI